MSLLIYISNPLGLYLTLKCMGFKNCILSIRMRIAICLLLDACLRCQAENKQEDCVGML